MERSNSELIEKINSILMYTDELIKKKANGYIKHDYLVPGGPYNEQWDWDGFFMGVALIAKDPSEAVYLKNWSLNFIESLDESSGKVPGCITPNGPDPRLNHMKPFLAQGVYLSSRALNDFSWIQNYWSKLEKICLYRENFLWDEKSNLGVWFDSMESGADNNVAALEMPHRTVVATDLNSFVYREYLSLAYIAEKINLKVEHKRYLDKAAGIKERMLNLLWDDNDKIFYNNFIPSNGHIKRIGYSSFIPLWANLIDQDAGRESIKKYMLSKDYMRSSFGMRTLSRQDPTYNNINMIKPHSNWQGPVWPIANYMYMHALVNYAFQEEAVRLARDITNLVITDIERTGGMHENYNAESGEPLAAPNFVSWNILVRNMLKEAMNMQNPLALP